MASLVIPEKVLDTLGERGGGMFTLRYDDTAEDPWTAFYYSKGKHAHAIGPTPTSAFGALMRQLEL